MAVKKQKPVEPDDDFDDLYPPADAETAPDWEGECEVCGSSPTVPMTGMCGPCTFGDASTVGGNW